MSNTVNTAKPVKTIKEEIEKALTTNPKYNFHGTKWFEKTHNQFYWNTESNNDWLTEEGFKTAHYRRTLLKQEKQKVEELRHWADSQSNKLAEDILEEEILVTLKGYDSVITTLFGKKMTLKEHNADNRLAIAKNVLEAQMKATFRRWDYQILKSLKVTG